MLRLARSLAPVALLPIAACPPKPLPTPTPAAAAAPPAGPGCPSAGGVFVASYLAQDPAAFNGLTAGDPAAPCTWPLERYTIGAARVDANGARVLMAGEPGAYATYDLAPRARRRSGTR